MQLRNQAILEPYIGLKGVWDFAKGNDITRAGRPSHQSAKVASDSVQTLKTSDGTSLRAAGAYDGLGAADQRAWQAQGYLIVPIKLLACRSHPAPAGLLGLGSNLSHRRNPSAVIDSAHYGGRGIRVCTRWRGIFLCFLPMSPSGHPAIIFLAEPITIVIMSLKIRLGFCAPNTLI